MQQNNMEDIFRKAFNENQPEFNHKSWERMQAALDKREKKRRFAFWLFRVAPTAFGLFLLLIAADALLSHLDSNDNRNESIQKEILEIRKENSKPKSSVGISNKPSKKEKVFSLTKPENTNTNQELFINEKPKKGKGKSVIQKQKMVLGFAMQEWNSVINKEDSEIKKHASSNSILSAYLNESTPLSPIKSKKAILTSEKDSLLQLVKPKNVLNFEKKPKKTWQNTNPVRFIQFGLGNFPIKNSTNYQILLGISEYRETKKLSLGYGIILGFDKLEELKTHYTDTTFGFGANLTDNQIYNKNKFYGLLPIQFGYKFNANQLIRFSVNPGLSMLTGYKHTIKENAPYDSQIKTELTREGWKAQNQFLLSVDVLYQRHLTGRWYADFGTGYHFNYSAPYFLGQLKYRIY